jgi:hypothetical protein
MREWVLRVRLTDFEECVIADCRCNTWKRVTIRPLTDHDYGWRIEWRDGLSESSELIYIDREGSYGDASGMLILKVSDLGEDGAKRLEEMKDVGVSLLDWACADPLEVIHL